MTSVDRLRPAAAIPVRALRMRGTAARMPVTSGGSIVGGRGVGTDTTVGDGVEVGVKVLVGDGVGEEVGVAV